jgi:hypothetical protein
MQRYAYHPQTPAAIGLVVVSIMGASLLIAVLSPYGLVYPASIVGIWTYLIGISAWYRRQELPVVVLSPLVLAQIFFALQLVVLPLTYMVFGLERGALPWLPTAQAVNTTILLACCAYAVFTWAALHVKTSRSTPISSLHNSAYEVAWRETNLKMLALVYLLLGCIGFYFYFGSVSRVAAYLLTPAEYLADMRRVPVTVTGALGTMLRPFLSFGIAAIWCLWVDGKRRAGNSRRQVSFPIVLGTVIVCLLLIAVNASFSFNRAAMLVPVLAVTSVYNLRVKRIPVRWLAGMGLVTVIWSLVVSGYRTSSLSLMWPGRSFEFRAWLAQTNLLEFVQVYGNGAQLGGFLLEETGWGANLYWGSTILSSLLYPMPGLGRFFRPSSGVTLYNLLIYNDTSSIDQVIPFLGELFINFHVVGLLLGYIGIGILLAHLNLRFLTARSSFGTYCLFVMSYWVAFLIIGGLAASSQIFIFMLWPIYIYAATPILRRRTTCAAPGRPQ